MAFASPYAPYAAAKRDAAAARTLAVILVGLAGTAFLAGIAGEFPGATPFGAGVLFGAHILVVGLAAFGALLEWGVERRADAVVVAALALAAVLTLVDLVNGFWFSAPWLGIGVLVTIIAFTRRLMAEDEIRHGRPSGAWWT